MPKFEDVNIDARILLAFIIGFASLASAFAGFQYWDDARNDSAIRAYANEHLAPRIRANERSINVLQSELKEVKTLIKSQENSRDRQYGHLKKQQDEIIQILSDVRDLGIRQ